MLGDWSHPYLTMDFKTEATIIRALGKIIGNGHLHKGAKPVHWCVDCRSALAEAEVEYYDKTSPSIDVAFLAVDQDALKTKFGVSNVNGPISLVIWTTTPWTLPANRAISIAPDFDYVLVQIDGQAVILAKDLVESVMQRIGVSDYTILGTVKGAELELLRFTHPFMDFDVPAILGDHVTLDAGTGAVHTAPGHGPDDYVIGQKYGLETANPVGPDGTYLPGTYPTLDGVNVFKANDIVIALLQEKGALLHVEKMQHSYPCCWRHKPPIIFRATPQWFVSMDQKGLRAQSLKEIKGVQWIPDWGQARIESMVANRPDWCISRQLWWGHRIPAWYDEAGNVYVGRNEDEVRKENNLGADVALRQDEDVLDTWFSSALWTFSTLGWPENTDALRQFHPTSVMVSGFDIIFFWIARMIMMTMHFIKDENGKPQVPFHTVYMTGLIRDDEGQKMSKSKGNVIDPLDMVDGISLPELLEKRTGNMMQPQLADKIRKRTEKQFPNGIEPHGTDALRFTLAALASTGRDINWDMKRLEGYRNFCNKLWNASRFVLMNTEGQDCGFNGGEMTLSLADRWILAEFNQTIKAYREALDSFRFDIAAGILYEFTWNQFCDWYLELTKPVMNGGTEAELRGTRHTLVTVLEGLLRLAHPIIPFITETIWQRVKVLCGITADTIMLQPFPQYDASQVDEAALADTEWLKQAIVAVRNIRAEMNIAPGKPLELLLRGCSADAERRVNENRGFLQTLARLESITVLPADDKGPVSVTKIVDGAELLIPMAGLINKEDELARLAKEVAKIEGEISRIENKLANEGFVARAPEAVIAKEREKLEGYAEAKAKLIEQQAVIAAL